ncbi:transcriptional regulator CtsR [Paenibacillus sp. UNCCL117]|uniref:CtsR family transcriptional regulator n=1 Tax=unclassified Paenibacillus TaxID=185978 RepID=UPI00088DDF92|nr:MULTISPECIES: CtsR family transcriptional regulator [unclassified Paenibacillus]SDE59222.1 transcriptional regulator CtsR [Paenibacillus sp. cl123]SFW68803.1 transcriptional regulator CtsR [Paenibacillus sp. UNCCL117]
MRSVSEMIEQHLKQIMQQSPDGVIEIQRNDLADQFNCVPSQINYVISTRFTLEKGYLVESKRGGGGYVRIQKIVLHSHGTVLDYIFQNVGTHIDQNASEGLIYRLQEGGFITAREAALMKAALDREALALKLPLRDEIRARMLKAMMICLLSK